MAKISVAGIKKNILWIACGLAILVGGVCWFIATGRLTTAFRQNKTTVDGKFKAINDRINNRDNNRSENSIAGIKRDISDAYVRVKKTWEELYREQAEKIFVWPQGLKQDFRDKIKDLDDKNVKWLADKGAGKAQGDPPSEEIPERLREDYQNFVRGEFRRLLQSIDAAGGDEAAAGAGLRWRDADRIDQTFNSRQTPSSTWIRLRQEDLWVYAGFAKVIQAVNKGVTGRTTLPIKIIDVLEIGDAAARSVPAQVGVRRIKRIHPSSGEAPSSSGSGSGGSGSGEDQLKDKRYVDNKTLKPISAGDLAAAMAATPEFKLIPFRLFVYMDQRDIDRLLVEFRNSVLPIQVMETRINASAGTAAFGQDAGGSVYHVPVEFRGVVYIYNPPSLKKPDFVKEAETAVAAATPAGETPAAEAAPGETPAAATPQEPAAEPAAADQPAAPAESKFVSQADGKLTIKSANDQEEELDLADDVQITVDGAEAKLDDLKADMTLELSRANGKVTAIHAKSAAEAPKSTP